MAGQKANLENFSDEEVLDQFIKRFKCDGAILIYLDSHVEYGFGQWKNAAGRKWVNQLFRSAQENDKTQIGSANSYVLKNRKL